MAASPCSPKMSCGWQMAYPIPFAHLITSVCWLALAWRSPVPERGGLCGSPQTSWTECRIQKLCIQSLSWLAGNFFSISPHPRCNRSMRGPGRLSPSLHCYSMGLHYWLMPSCSLAALSLKGTRAINFLTYLVLQPLADVLAVMFLHCRNQHDFCLFTCLCVLLLSDLGKIRCSFETRVGFFLVGYLLPTPGGASNHHLPH